METRLQESESFREKIKFSNIMSRVFIGLSIPFDIYAYNFVRPVNIYIISVIIALFFVPLLNKYRYYNTSRAILTSTVMIITCIFHAYVMQPGENAIPSLLVLEFSLSVIPFIVYGTTEIYQLGFSILLNLLLIIFIQQLNPLFDFPVDNSYFKSGILSPITYLVASIIFLFPIYSFVRKNDIFINQLQEKTAVNERFIKEIEEININSQILIEISEILRARDITVTERFQKSLYKLARHLKCGQGALFLEKEQAGRESTLTMIANFGSSNPQNFNFSIGEGYVGECFRKSELIKLSGINDPSFIIKSGIGNSQAENLVLSPLNFNLKTFGVMELVSFTPFNETQLALINRVSETLAAFFISSKMEIKIA